MDSDNKSQIISLMDILKNEKEEDRIIRTLKRLNKFTMTVDILQDTGIGKLVNQFRKREDQVGPMAKALVNKWKQDVAKLIADSAEKEGSPSTKRSPSPDQQKNNKRQKTEHSKERRESSSKKSEKNGIGDDRKDRHKSDSRSRHGESDSKSRHSDKDRHRSESRHESSKDRKHGESSKHESSKHKSSRHHESSKSKHGESSKDRKHDSLKSSEPAEIDLNKSLSELSSGSGSETKCARRKERKSTLSKFQVPTPPVAGTLQECDILASLPQTVTYYKPLPHINQSPSKRRATDEEIGAKKHSRSVMYSGKKTKIIAKVPSLFDACLEILMDNVDKIECVGPTPYHVFKPVLQKCTAEQLYNLENYNPHFLEDTDELWDEHCKKEFRGKERNKDDCESWRELYLRCYEERENKLKKLAANISVKHSAKKDEGRKTKLAFVDVLAKPPRDVLRRQKIHGTGGPVHKTVDPLERLSSRGGQPGKSSIRAPIMRNQVTNDVVSPPSVRPSNKKPSTAPMMQRTMRMMKKMRR